MPKDKPSFKERQAADNAALLSDIIEAGGLINVRFDKEFGARLAIRFDAITGHNATQLFIRYRAADRPSLHRAACVMLLDELGGGDA